MNEYQLPEEPAGPVWDQHGSRWVRIPETYPVLWKTDDDACQRAETALANYVPASRRKAWR